MIKMPYREFWNLYRESELGTEEFRMMFPITMKMIDEYFQEHLKDIREIGHETEIFIYDGNIFELPTDCDEELHSRRYKEFIDSDYHDMFFLTLCLLMPFRMIHWSLNSVVYNIDTNETMVTIQEYMFNEKLSEMEVKDCKEWCHNLVKQFMGKRESTEQHEFTKEELEYFDSIDDIYEEEE